MTNKVLITGAGGFIGGHLWRYLGQLGYLIIACVTQKPLHPPDYGQVHLLRLPDQQIVSILEHEKPDWLIHCAGSSSISQSILNPHQDFKDNVLATEALFETIARNSPTTKMIFISSAAVYGNPAELPIREDARLNPISPYGFHKLIGELISQKYYRLFGVPVTILRIFSVYGPGLKKQILWDIYQKWLTSDTISLYGTGEETRDFVYISDLLKIIHLVIENSDFEGTAINVGTGRAITIRELADLMIEKLGGKKSIRFTGQIKSGDPNCWQADTRWVNALGMTSWLPIETGIENYVNWLRSEVKGI